MRHYVADLSITGLTSNPSSFDLAIGKSNFYDEAIRRKTEEGKSGEMVFFELAIENLAQAAELFRPIYEATGGLDGWVSLEVSPLRVYDAAGTVKAAVQLRAQAHRHNLFIKIPGTTEGLSAIEETIFAGVPVNVTLLFSSGQYIAAAEAYLRGIERRIAAGLNPKVRSVASMFISRWDKAVMGRVPKELQNCLGIAIAKRTYKAYRNLLASPRWLKASGAGAQPQRLLWASTDAKHPAASDVLYVKALAAPDTIHTIPEETLLAFAGHGAVDEVLQADGGDAERVIAEFNRAGIDDEKLAADLQREGAEAFVSSWKDLLDCVESKSATLKLHHRSQVPLRA